MTLTAQIDPSSDADQCVVEQLERLKKTIVERDQTIDNRDQTIIARDLQVALLTERLKQLIDKIYGRKSEKFNPDQQALFDTTCLVDVAELEAKLDLLTGSVDQAADDVPGAVPAQKAPRKQPVRKALPEHLPRVVEHQSAKHCQCLSCGGALHEVGTEVSEKLAVKPVEYYVRQIIRPTLSCRTCERMHYTPTLPEIIDGGMPDPTLLAQVMIHKYCDHIPLHRQSEIAKRSDVELPVSSLAEWVGKCGVALRPLVDILRQQLHQRVAVHADETPIQMLNPSAKAHAQNVQRAYLFAYRSAELGTEPIVVFDFQTSRAGAHAAQFLQGYTGALVVDDFAGYKKLFSDTPMQELACWAHARRKFFELHVANKSALAAEALKRISEIYMLEREVKDSDADARFQHRQTHSVPKVTALFDWLKSIRPTTANSSGTAKAMDYLLRREVSFLRFLTDGRFPIDNNPVENAIRPIALGRKNWLFAGSARAGERAAAIMSLLATAKACGLNPHVYLTDILTRLPSTKDKDIASLLPQNWVDSRKTT